MVIVANNFIRKIKTFFCRLFTGMPLTHATASLGGGKYIHVDKIVQSSGNKTGLCSGFPVVEDMGPAARGNKGSKYLFEYEVLVPNYAEFGKALNLPDKAAVEKFFKEDWTKTMVSSTGPGATKSTCIEVFATVFNTARPKKYDITKVFNPRPKVGYSCSGLISTYLARYGIDVVKKYNKQVNKTTPADLMRSPLFTIAYSNDRPAFEKARKS